MNRRPPSPGGPPEAAARQTRTAQRPRRRPIRRTVLIAACLVLALTATAGATGVLKSAVEVFSPLFGGAPAQTEIIDKIGYPVGACDTDNGVTVTADAVMGDAYNAVIVYTISRDDGTRLLPEDISGDMLLVHGNGTDLNVLGGTHGGSYFVVEDPAASSIQMVETLSSDRPINDCTATGTFENIYKWDEATGEAVPIIEGNWKVKFEMAYEDSSISLGSGETFTQGGMTFTIDSISLSPVAYQVNYTVDSEAVWSDSGSGKQSEEDRLTTERYFENVEILLTLTDGTVLDLSNAGGSIGPEGRRHRLLQGRDLLPGGPHGGDGKHLRGRCGVPHHRGVIGPAGAAAPAGLCFLPIPAPHAPASPGPPAAPWPALRPLAARRCSR